MTVGEGTAVDKGIWVTGSGQATGAGEGVVVVTLTAGWSLR